MLGDAKIAVAPTGDTGIQSPAPTLNARIMGPVRTVADRIWPGVAIVPTMSTGATDGRFLNARPAGGATAAGAIGGPRGLEARSAIAGIR